MAANIPEGTRTVEAEETHEECSGKKKSKFQAFKKLFVKKKRKEPSIPNRESNLKPSQSSSDVSASGANTNAFHDDHESTAKGNMGSKAVSHDSVFISEMEGSVKEDICQECTPGKVKALQLQLQQNIRIGSPPQGIVHKKLEDSGTLSEDDGLPRSPPEITSLHEILAQSSGKSSVSAKRRSSISLGGTDSEDEPESSELSSRPTSPLPSNVLLSPTSPASHFPLADFTLPASSVNCLDNSAAKHKILVKPKKRKAPTMNAKPTQVEEQIQVKILMSEKSSMEHEAEKEEVKNTEDVLQKPKEDMIVSVCEPQMDVSDTTLLLEVSLLENQPVSFHNEAACSETDVDFHGSRESTGDQVDPAVENSEMKDATSSSQSSDFLPGHENNDITVMVTTSEIDIVESAESNTDEIESPLLNTSKDLVYETNPEEAEATALSEIKDEEYNVHGQETPNVQHDALNVIESDVVASETLQQNMLSVESVSTMIKDDDVPEGVGSYESNNREHLGIVEIMKNSEVILEVSDQLATNDEDKNEHSPSEQKTETSNDIITDGNEECDNNNVHDIAPAVITNVNDSRYTSITTSAHDSANSGTSIEIFKDNKVAEPNSDSHIRGSNKPVRFTVAPAWQRALSSGSSVKDSHFIKNVRSESLEGADESVVQSSKRDNTVQKDKEESCGHFGVRLRRTSSSIKYSEDNQEEISRQGVPPVDSSSLLPGRNQQTPKRTQSNSESSKMSKVSTTHEEKSTLEVRSQPKPRAEDQLLQERSEPAWITMAKLKRKGFQEPLLSREPSNTTENEKVEGTDCTQKINVAISLQEVKEEKTRQATNSPASPEEARSDSEKSTSSTQPQNPAEPPWFSLAKKKAKAWSEMPQIVQQ